MKPIVLFQFCSHETPLNRLWSRRRWMDFIVVTWVVSIGGMIEGLITLLFIDHSIFSSFLTDACTAVGLLCAVPAIVLFVGVEECERELARRSSLPTAYVSLDDRLPRYFARILLLVLVMLGLQYAFH